MAHESIKIETEFTPNPHSLKFNVNRDIIPVGAFSFPNVESAEKAPLAKKLFQVEGVREILIGKTFITVARESSIKTWATLIQVIGEALRDHLLSGELAVFPELSQDAGKAGSEVEQRIRTFLDEKIRPALARDGGDVVFESFKDGVVALQLRGACSHCPSATLTLKAGVERLLREEVPEVKEVIQV